MVYSRQDISIMELRSDFVCFLPSSRLDLAAVFAYTILETGSENFLQDIDVKNQEPRW